MRHLRVVLLHTSGPPLQQATAAACSAVGRATKDHATREAAALRAAFSNLPRLHAMPWPTKITGEVRPKGLNSLLALCCSNRGGEAKRPQYIARSVLQ